MIRLSVFCVFIILIADKQCHAEQIFGFKGPRIQNAIKNQVKKEFGTIVKFSENIGIDGKKKIITLPKPIFSGGVLGDTRVFTDNFRKVKVKNLHPGWWVASQEIEDNNGGLTWSQVGKITKRKVQNFIEVTTEDYVLLLYEDQMVLTLFDWYTAQDLKPRMVIFIPHGQTILKNRGDGWSSTRVKKVRKIKKTQEIYEITMRDGRPQNFMDADIYILYHNVPISCTISIVNKSGQAFMAGVGIGVSLGAGFCPPVPVAGHGCLLSSTLSGGFVMGLSTLIDQIFGADRNPCLDNAEGKK